MNVKYFQIVLLFSFYPLISPAQTFHNLDFEQPCDSSKTQLCHWDISWSYKINGCISDQTNKNQSLLISSQEEAGIGYVEQKAIIDDPSVFKLVTFSGKIKTENVVGKGADITINTFNAKGEYLFVTDLEKDGLDLYTGSHDWQDFKIKAICAPKATSIKIGGILYGKGKVWYDDFKVEVTLLKNRTPSKIAKEYLDHFCNIVAEHSLRRDVIDLEMLKSQALQIAGDAKNYSDCHLAVRHIISGLGDHHSFLMTSEKYENWANAAEESPDIPFPQHQQIKGFGYLSLPGFHSGDEALKVNYVDSIQQALQYYDQQQIKGWIIDLRANDGGNMEPMLAGLGPLFSAKTVGYLVDVNGKKEAWGYKRNRPFSGKYLGTPASDPIKLKNKDLPIAVLIGPRTGSSGEIVVISFIGNKNTRLFGKPTWGISTGNGEFELLDGARFFLTSTVMADRSGKLYGEKVIPDQWIKEENQGDEDIELLEAIKWLEPFNHY